MHLWFDQLQDWDRSLAPYHNYAAKGATGSSAQNFTNLWYTASTHYKLNIESKGTQREEPLNFDKNFISSVLWRESYFHWHIAIMPIEYSMKTFKRA